MKTDSNDHKKDFENSLSFVISHYEQGQFDEKAVWRKIMGSRFKFLDRRWIAAASIAFVLGASAFVYSVVSIRTNQPEMQKEVLTNTSTSLQKESVTEKITFNNAPLEEVISKIEDLYGVEILNKPTQEITVTISYEGTAEEVVDILNETFNIDLKLKGK